METTEGNGTLTMDALRAALGAGQRSFPGLRLGGADGVDLDLSDCDLRGGCFKEVRFGHARFGGANLERCGFQRSLVWGADLSGVRAAGSSWQEADLSGSRLQGADFSGALMHRCCLRGVVAAGSLWVNARLVEADFRRGQDQLTDLGGACFRGADLSFAQLQGARLQDADLRDCRLYGANLRGADLRNANLRGCDLSDATIEEADLGGADLTETSLGEARRP